MTLVDQLRFLTGRSFGQRAWPNDAKPLIEALMRQEIWYDEFIDILDARTPYLEDAIPALRVALAHFGVAWPDAQTAQWWQLEEMMQAITTVQIDPFDGLRAFMDRLLWEPTDPAFYKMVDIEAFVKTWYEFDDRLDYQSDFLTNPDYALEVAELKAALVRKAGEWLALHGGAGVPCRADT